MLALSFFSHDRVKPFLLTTVYTEAPINVCKTVSIHLFPQLPHFWSSNCKMEVLLEYVYSTIIIIYALSSNIFCTLVSFMKMLQLVVSSNVSALTHIYALSVINLTYYMYNHTKTIYLRRMVIQQLLYDMVIFVL